MINDLWYKNAVIYCLSVATYMDANGDGIGDFKGLLRRLDYLQGLGITALWLMPFQPSPNRDDGYDVADYYGVDPRFDADFAYHFGLDKPVIAAINGAAAGVGLVLAAFADLRFAAAGAKFTTAHGRFNFPAEFGLSWVLPRIVGLTHANDLLLSSRVFTAEEAYAMGFLNKVLPAAELMDHVREYAAMLARSVAPGSARETKRQIYRDLHRTAAEAVIEAERLLDQMARHPDYAEGVKAWMEKREAAWQG